VKVKISPVFEIPDFHLSPREQTPTQKNKIKNKTKKKHCSAYELVGSGKEKQQEPHFFHTSPFSTEIEKTAKELKMRHPSAEPTPFLV